ncbi:phosphoglucomutase/phosphomannomutase family protein [Deinococcus aquatilis]|uniref:phosphoglucomutase/phosphomannomutase family protein n=1 Tax=Deinococcus aquatilis TaxID=519440 RepID=UPI00035C7A57|nr:phosphoglucomutase/phosphomannomutase family protein [Deinococcus aquatilis]
MSIKFGTDGWRDVLAEGFTFANVTHVAAAHARYLTAQGGKSVVVGYDTRFLGERFAHLSATVMAQHGLNVWLSQSFLPTPVVSFATRHLGAAGGAMITASHNPPEYNGYKFKGPYGGSATPEIVGQVEAELSGVEAPGRTPGEVTLFDGRRSYFESLDRLLDLDTLRSYQGVLYHDAMGGAGCGWLEAYAQHAGLGVEIRPLHGQPDPQFYGVNPEPIAPNLAELMSVMTHEKALTFGTATDGDADRLGIVVAGGAFFNSHQIFAVLLKHLHGKGLRGRVIKTVSTSRIVELLAEHLGLSVTETPIGFKYVTDAFLEGEQDAAQAVLIGGEESGGLGVQGHLPERDGLFNSLLLLEAVAQSGRSLPDLFRDIELLTGFSHAYDRVDLKMPASFNKNVTLNEVRGWTEIAGWNVQSINERDGVKLLLDREAWVLVRASGTEPLLRVYVEADSPTSLRIILEEVVQRVGG